jgi:hypothetical protein
MIKKVTTRLCYIYTLMFVSFRSFLDRLAGKVALITGEATSAEFVWQGVRDILTDVQDDLGRHIAEELSLPRGPPPRSTTPAVM